MCNLYMPIVNTDVFVTRLEIILLKMLFQVTF